MSWLEVSIHVPRRHATLAESLLASQGALSVTFSDDSAFSGESANDVLEPGVGETPMWPDVCVTGLFPGETKPEPVLLVTGLLPGAGLPHRTRYRFLDDQDWQRAWMDHFRPMRFGRNLWIVPAGFETPESADSAEATVLHLDPGLAFGTGTHPTTRLCLEWLDGTDCAGLTVLDYGCGSGVLGIAAALKGAACVICVDNDPQALLATRENAQRNGVDEVVKTLEPGKLLSGETGSKSAELVVANILTAPLISLAPVLASAAGAGAGIALSGILREQADEVRAAYLPFTGAMTAEHSEGWVRLDGKIIPQGAGASDAMECA